jgi:hypothetical protein
MGWKREREDSNGRILRILWCKKMAVYWIVAPYSLVDVYRRVRSSLEAARISEALVSCYQTARRCNPEGTCTLTILRTLNPTEA